MTNTIDVMLDIETLGVSDDSQVIQISAGAFHLEEPVNSIEDMGTFDVVLDLSTLGGTLSIEQGTLSFWTGDPENAKVLHRMLQEDTGVTEGIMVKKFHEWLKKLSKAYEDVRVWGNGIIFDNVKVENLFKKYDLVSPIRFYNHRDVRTIVELVAIKNDTTVAEYRRKFEEGIEKHNAIHDVLYQARYVTSAYAELTRDEHTKYVWQYIGSSVYVGQDRDGYTVYTGMKDNPMIHKMRFTEAEAKELFGSAIDLYKKIR